MKPQGKDFAPVIKSIGFASALIFVLVISAIASETVTITDISGAKTTGTLKSWSKDVLSISTTEDRDFPRAEIRSISWNRPQQKKSPGAAELWISNGDRISARPVSVANDQLTFSWPVLEEASPVPLENVVAVIFEWPEDQSERLRLIADFQTLPPGNDLVILINGDRSLGSFERIDAAHLELKIGANVLKLDRSRVRAVRLNPELTTIERQPERRAVLTMADGSRLTATTVELLDNVFRIKSPSLGALKIPTTSVTACHFFGDRLIPLADYEPAQVESIPYLSTTWPLIRNSNARRGPLALRGVEFVTGLGMHSRMVVKYELKGKELGFQADVGIDDLAGGQGSANFAVELDGVRVWTSPELTGKSPAMSIPTVDVRGKKQLTLIVDYGEFGDVLDYANWCDALMIVEPVR